MLAETNQAPDMATLQREGVSLEDAIARCEAWAATHAQPAEPTLNLVAYQPAAPELAPAAVVVALPALMPAPVQPAAPELDAMSAMSQLHTLFQEAERGRQACLTTLMNAGWSESTSRELKKTIDASLGAQRKVIK